jgi:hypothetical protein
VIALFLLPLVGRSARDWGRFALGALPVGLALAAYNTIVFGSWHVSGYTAERVDGGTDAFAGSFIQGLVGNLAAPGRGMLVYSPVILFSIAGAVIGRRIPVVRWCALAALAYILLFAKYSVWWGGQSFGYRLLSETLPLLAVLLVPALDRIAGTRWRLLFAAALAWSVAVELLAVATPTPTWFDTHNSLTFGVWWHPFDNEIVTLATSAAMPHHVAEMSAIVAIGVLLGAIAAYAAEAWSAPRVKARASPDGL